VSVSIVLNHVTLLLSIGTNFVNGKKEGAKFGFSIYFSYIEGIRERKFFDVLDKF